MNENANSKRLLLAVAYDNENNTYSVDVPAGSNAAETAFAMSVVIKCFVKDGVIENAKIITDMIDKYVNDSQYAEV